MKSAENKTRSDRAIVWVILCGAAIVGLAALVQGIYTIVSELSHNRFGLTLAADLQVPQPADPGTAQIVEGTFTEANVTISNLAGAPVGLLIAGHIATILTSVIIATAVILLCTGVLRGTPFTRPIAISIIAVSSTLMIGSLLSQAFYGFAGVFATEQISQSSDFWAEFSISVDGTPIMAGFVIAIVAFAFELGNRMQRDTEGLI